MEMYVLNKSSVKILYRVDVTKHFFGDWISSLFHAALISVENEKFSLSLKKISSNQLFTKSKVKTLLSRNFCEKSEFVVHTVWKIYEKTRLLFHVISMSLLKKLLKNWFHGNFWAWSRFKVPRKYTATILSQNFREMIFFFT